MAETVVSLNCIYLVDRDPPIYILQLVKCGMVVNVEVTQDIHDNINNALDLLRYRKDEE